MIHTTERNRHRITAAALRSAASIFVIAAGASPAWAQQSDVQPPPQQLPPPPPQQLPPAPPVDDSPGAEASTSETAVENQQPEATDTGIVVTGFRRSLNAALNVKRQSVAAVDAIVAEDIAKFPDQNLAESLQRIPGISIERDAGEGRAITVRGLGAQFTRVRVNGMETIATSTDGAGANRDRSFDFNVFASELFSSIVVHKTAEPSLDEGSLGAVVDLNTGNALAGPAGLTFVASAQASYNDLSENFGPRVAGLVGWSNEAGTLGAQVSAAYSRTDNLELGNNTVRWEQSRFNSVDGVPCWYNSAGDPVSSGGNFNPNAGDCGDVALAFHPRIPRYGAVGHDRRRLGATGSIQFEPTEQTRLSLDGLYSKFKEDRDEQWGEVLFRSNQRRIDLVDFAIDPATNNLVSGTFNNAWVRTENYLRKSQTEFHQLGASWDQDLSENFRFTLLGGMSRSDADIPVETTMIFDDRDALGYRYDYTDSRHPVLSFGTSVTDPANFQLAEIRDRPSNVTNKFRTAQLRTEWDVNDDFAVKTGLVHRRFTFDTEGFTRDTAVCGSSGPDRVLGTLTCSPSVYGFPVTPDLAELFELGDAGQPSGTTDEWLVPDLDATTSFTGLYNRTARPQPGNIRSVVEKVTGGYLQFDAKGYLGGVRYAGNFGVRYARTDQSSTGLLSGTEVTIERDYEDWLPSGNLAVYPTENIILRAAAARVMTRPSLGSLTPGGSADGFNFRINYGNPNLKPFRANAYDLAAEWYFARESIASVALFQKDVESFPVGQTVTGVVFNDTGLPASVLVPSSPGALDPALRAAPIWQISQPVNGEGAKFQGLELAIQGPFRFLPGLLSNFGGIANATFVRSTAEYTVAPPFSGFNPANGNYATQPAIRRTATFFPLSKRAFNATLYYDDGKFSARGSASYRSRYLSGTSGNRNMFEGFNSTINFDAAVRYAINEQFEVSLEGINLTDEYRDRFVDIDANRIYENNHFGRTFQFGVRYRH